jgi:hypothetical protein
LAGVLLAGACQSPEVAVDPLPPVLAGEVVSYRLVTNGPAVDSGSSAQREIVGAVQAALAAQGMREVARGSVPDMVVTLDYRIGPPHEGRVNESEATYEVTPGGEAYESVPVSLGATGSTIYELRMVKQPDVRVYTGERPVSVVRTLYEKRLRLSARMNTPGPEGGPGREVWSLEMIAEGRNRSLARMLPALTGPGRAFLGSAAEGAAVLHVNDDSGAVESVERAL